MGEVSAPQQRLGLSHAATVSQRSRVAVHPPLQLRPHLCWLLILLAVSSGCASGAAVIQASPLSPEEQQESVLAIVPPGTFRDEAARRLRAAGIDFTPSANDSIYYCDIWNRTDGNRWHLDVALLFDESGKLYEARRGQADVGLADPLNVAEALTNGVLGTSGRSGDAAPTEAATRSTPGWKGRGEMSRTPY